MLIRKASGEEMLNLWGYEDEEKAPPTARFFYQNISSGNAVFWTVEHGGELIGELYAFLKIEEDTDFADGKSAAYLCAFRVKKEYRGQGIGSRMMEAALSDLKARGFQSATIGVSEERNERLYRRLGFTTKIKDCYFDPCARDEHMRPEPDAGFRLLSRDLSFGGKKMAEEFLTLMADLDDEAQARMSTWYGALREAGFTGQQTPGLPFHISLATFPPEKEREAVEIMEKAAGAFSAVPVHISHMGLFAGGRVLFCAPERNPQLDALHAACEKYPSKYPWTPHATVLIDEPATVCAALPVLVKHFSPFVANIERLHLCAFWPTREILSVPMRSD